MLRPEKVIVVEPDVEEEDETEGPVDKNGNPDKIEDDVVLDPKKITHARRRKLRYKHRQMRADTSKDYETK